MKHINEITVAEKLRTGQQQAAIEVACRLLADAFDAHGVDKLAVLEKKHIPVNWTQGSVKDDLFKPVMTALYGKTSTTRLSTAEVSDVWNRLSDFTDEHWNIRIDFPSNIR